MMAIIGGVIMFGGLIKNLEYIAICGSIIMSAGYLGLVLDNNQKKNMELIKVLVNNLINNLRK